MTRGSTEDRRHAALRVLHLVDLTNLDEACSEDDVVLLCDRAHGRFGSVAAVCVWPRFVALAHDRLQGSGIGVATVINFPHGTDSRDDIVALIARCLDDGADDIDLVLPYRDFLDGRMDRVDSILDAARAAVPSSAHLKVILETGELVDPMVIRSAAERALDHGADFIKTSTGKTAVSATPESVRIMLDVLADHARRPGASRAGVKPSGGIRTLDDALQYLDLADEIMGPQWASPATFRFGASALVDALESELARSDSGGGQ